MGINNDTLLNVQEIVKRAKEFMGFKTDLELAQYLGIARSTLSNWMNRNSIDYPLILEKMKNRVYLVKKKEGKATLCYINTKKRTVTEIATGRAFPFRLVEDIKDMTYHYMNEKSLMDEFVEL